MATISIEARISTEQLVQAAAQLSPQELASLVARLVDLQAGNKNPQATSGNVMDQDPDIEALAARVKAGRQRILGLNPGGITTTADFDDPLPDEFWLGGK